ncbi:MAG: response regulator [Magnetococcales bacterium]|nr:response regulator [Magnetococcales bacterium]
MATILCVEDDPQLLALYQRVLEEQGFVVLTAREGRAAQRLLETLAVDLVITDILMPDTDGIELIGYLLSHPPPPLVIAVSGGGQYFDGNSLLRAVRTLGVENTLLKPFSGKHLVETVRQVLATGQIAW